jgi:hypothetical protein
MWYTDWTRKQSEEPGVYKSLMQVFEITNKNVSDNCILTFDGKYIKKYLGSIVHTVLAETENVEMAFSGYTIESLLHTVTSPEDMLQVLIDDFAIFEEDVIPDKIIKLYMAPNKRTYEEIHLMPNIDWRRRSLKKGIAVLRRAKGDDLLDRQ